MSQDKSVAIVGAGYIADYHMSALRALSGVKVVAVCDLKESAAQRFANAYGIPGVYGDLSEMLAKEKLEDEGTKKKELNLNVLSKKLELMEQMRQRLEEQSGKTDSALNERIAQQQELLATLTNQANEGRRQLSVLQ